MKNPFTFTNIQPLMDGLPHPAGKADPVTLDLPNGGGTYHYLMRHLRAEGWDCNAASYTAMRVGVRGDDTIYQPHDGGHRLDKLEGKV